jgi:hypothetical protein
MTIPLNPPIESADSSSTKKQYSCLPGGNITRASHRPFSKCIKFAVVLHPLNAPINATPFARGPSSRNVQAILGPNEISSFPLAIIYPPTAERIYFPKSAMNRGFPDSLT